MDKKIIESIESRERSYENSIAGSYEREYHEPPIMARHSHDFVEFVAQHVKPGDRVLDLGCASAVLWKLFDQLLPSNITLVGVDLSPEMLSIARNNFPRGKFLEGSFFDLPLDSGTFDVVVVSSAFHHIGDNHLPLALKEITRVLDEHGVLIGREPLMAGRLTDIGGWLCGALMNLRHLAYRLTHTREYPEPDPGPDHHAYVAKPFLRIIGKYLTITEVKFRNPISPFLARIRDEMIVLIAEHLDNVIQHRLGNDIYYVGNKNYSTSADVERCIHKAMISNEVSKIELANLCTHIAAAAKIIEQKISNNDNDQQDKSTEY